MPPHRMGLPEGSYTSGLKYPIRYSSHAVTSGPFTRIFWASSEQFILISANCDNAKTAVTSVKLRREAPAGAGLPSYTCRGRHTRFYSDRNRFKIPCLSETETALNLIMDPFTSEPVLEWPW